MIITEQEFLEKEVQEMNLTMSNPLFVNLAKSVARYCKKFNAKNVIDFGCGTGVYAEVLRQDGYDVLAQDIFKTHRDYCRENYPDLKVIVKPKKADLMLFIEVAEHMTDEEIKIAIEAIQPSFILFSSTSNVTEYDQAWGHINIKDERAWVNFWSTLGYSVLEKPQTPTTWSMTLKRI
jgi:2-polyprenyl-3-methyl-5-hydroxy-6-metoxy-1,4-benzoquinol methylase